GEPAAQVGRAYRLALGRPPKPGELAAMTKFLSRETAAAAGERPTSAGLAGARRKALARMGRVIFNLNEFAYPDRSRRGPVTSGPGMPSMSEQIISYRPNRTPCGRTRREFLWQVGGGFAGLALIDLLSRDQFFAAQARTDESDRDLNPSRVRPSHFPARAKRAVFLFMNGAPSQVDTFDPKPALEKFDGTPYQGKTPIGSNGRPIGRLMKSPFTFVRHGESGLPISELFPHTA